VLVADMVFSPLICRVNEIRVDFFCKGERS
jgi:hypothetical protein